MSRFFSNKKFFSKRAMGVTLVVVLVLAFGALAGAQSISLGYVMWDSEIASHAVVAAVIEDYLGYDVEHMTMDAGPMWAGIAQGEFDITLAVGLPVAHQHYYEEYWADVENLGASLHGQVIGLVVPEYVTIDSIEELNDYRNEFGGQIVGIDPGSGTMSTTEKVVEAYDLDLMLVDGSDAAMTAALQAAIRRNEWVVVTGWTPHWKFAEWDLKFLDDPLDVYGGPQQLNKVVKPGLHEKAPDVYAFMQRFYWMPDDMAAVMLDVSRGADPMDAARAWIADNEDVVQSWLP